MKETKDKANLFDYEHFYIIVFLIILVVFSFVFLSFSITNSNKKANGGRNVNKVVGKASEVKMNVNYRVSEYILLDNAIPLTDETGMKLDGNNTMKFSIDADYENVDSALYEIYAVVDGTSTLDEKYIKVYLEKNGDTLFRPKIFKSETKKDILGENTVGMILDKEELAKGTKNDYVLKVWVDENYDNYKESKTFKIYIKVIGRQNV